MPIRVQPCDLVCGRMSPRTHMHLELLMYISFIMIINGDHGNIKTTLTTDHITKGFYTACL